MSEPAEVAELYARACPRLIGLLTSICGSRSDAEEVAQDAFVRLLAHWDEVRGYDDPEAWVRRVAVRLLISRHRRTQVARLGLRRLAQDASVFVAEAGPDAVAIDVALRTLPVSQRAVVVLHHVLDLPVEQIATDLGVPVGTVKSRLARARSALAAQLTDTEEAVDHA